MVDKKIPPWLCKKFNQEQAEKISAQIAQVESKTRAELVAVVVQRSSAIGHVPWVLMLLLASLFFIAETIMGGLQWDRHLEVATPVAAVVIYFLSHALARISCVQRILTPNADEIWQVQQRAELEFYHVGVSHTKQGTGILIFVSWMERRAVILADKGVASLCSEEVWFEIVDLMLKEFKQRDFYSGLEKAIRRCGEILAEKLPAGGVQPANQLSNHLIIK